MAGNEPSPQPSPGRNRLTKPAPNAAETLARGLLEEDLRATSRTSALMEFMKRMLRRLTTPASAGGSGSSQDYAGSSQNYGSQYGSPSPVSQGAPVAAAGEKSARQVLSELSPAEAQQVMQAALNLISDNPSHQRAYKAGRLPVVEELLDRAALGDQSPSSPARPASMSEPEPESRAHSTVEPTPHMDDARSLDLNIEGASSLYHAITSDDRSQTQSPTPERQPSWPLPDTVRSSESPLSAASRQNSFSQPRMPASEARQSLEALRGLMPSPDPSNSSPRSDASSSRATSSRASGYDTPPSPVSPVSPTSSARRAR